MLCFYHPPNTIPFCASNMFSGWLLSSNTNHCDIQNLLFYLFIQSWDVPAVLVLTGLEVLFFWLSKIVDSLRFSKSGLFWYYYYYYYYYYCYYFSTFDNPDDPESLWSCWHLCEACTCTYWTHILVWMLIFGNSLKNTCRGKVRDSLK